MVRKRSIAAGMTDYTGVPLDDIIAHLREWNAMTGECIENLHSLRERVLAVPTIFEFPQDVVRYVDYVSNLLERYVGDFDRLLIEIPRSVQQSHIELLEQIYRSSQLEQNASVQFKSDFIERNLPDEKARAVLDEIYSESRSMLIDYSDLSNLVPRLRTFISPSMNRSEVFQLKPSFWGIGIDLKAMVNRVRNWWSRRRAP